MTDTRLLPSGKEFLLESAEGLKRVEVLEIQFHQDNWLIRLSGLETRDQAQALKGRRLLIADTRLRPLDEDEFFYIVCLDVGFMISTEKIWDCDQGA